MKEMLRWDEASPTDEKNAGADRTDGGIRADGSARADQGIRKDEGIGTDEGTRADQGIRMDRDVRTDEIIRRDETGAAAGRRIVVTTPEHVELRFETAGIGSRTGAQMIDVLILAVINAAIVLLLWLVFGRAEAPVPAWAEEYAVAIAIVVFSALNGGYFLIGEYVTGGRTVGKQAMGLRVIQDNGRPLSFLASAIRNLLRIVDMLPALYFIGALFSFFHPHDKRLGDIAAGTVVVYELRSAQRRKRRLKRLLASWRPLLPDLALEPWMKERVTEQEWALLSNFVERLHYLSPERANRLANGIVELLAPKLGLEERWDDQQQRHRHAEADSARQKQPRRPASVAWALSLYEALQSEWDMYAAGGER